VKITRWFAKIVLLIDAECVNELIKVSFVAS